MEVTFVKLIADRRSGLIFSDPKRTNHVPSVTSDALPVSFLRIAFRDAATSLALVSGIGGR